MSSEVTQLIEAARAGDRQAAANLLPLVYEELRRLAKARMASESPGRTLQATALVHEAYLRLVTPENGDQWDGRGHFFAAAAEAMRRILIDDARRRGSKKRGGGAQRVELSEFEPVADFEFDQAPDHLLALDRALEKLKIVDGTAAELVQLRYFAGLPMAEVARVLDIPLRRAERTWSYARAWLFQEVNNSDDVD